MPKTEVHIIDKIDSYSAMLETISWRQKPCYLLDIGGRRVKVKAQAIATSGLPRRKKTVLPNSIGVCRPPRACGKLREGLGIKAGTDKGAATPNSTVMGFSKKGRWDTRHPSFSLQVLTVFLGLTSHPK